MKIYMQKLFLGTLLLSIATISQAQDYRAQLEKATKYYSEGKFLELIEEIKHIPYSECEINYKISAHKLLAMCYLAVDSIEKSDNEISKMLTLKPNYESEPLDPLLLVDRIADVQAGILETVTFSVSKNAEDLLKTPATINVIKENDIFNRGYMNLEQMLHDLPGFDIATTSGVTYANIYQRGYRSKSTDRTLFLVDGVEENELNSNIAYTSRQYSISNIKRLEVVYGPASTMYGANAFTGVINVVTKEASDIIESGKNIGGLAQVSYGTWNTKCVDVSTAARWRKVSLLLTGRLFRSDEMNKGGKDGWEYKTPDDDTYLKLLTTTGNTAATLFEQYNGSPLFSPETDAEGNITKLIPTELAISKARQSDQRALDTTVLGSPVGYSNETDDWLMSGKLKISDFTFGFQSWRRNEGKIGWYNDKRGGSKNGAVWVPQNSFLYMKYDTYLSDNISLSIFTQYKTHKLADDTKKVEIKSYYHGSYKLKDLLENRQSEWFVNYYSRISKQMRSEIRSVYTSPKHDFNVVSGFEMRNSFIQGDYIESDTIYPSENGYPPEIAGGNHFNSLDLGYYLQSSYGIPRLPLKLTLGARIDYNKIRENGGYGTVLNPKVTAVFYPADFVFKIMYATAFKDASAFDKYATTAARKLSNPTLEPEMVNNFEISAYWGKENYNCDFVIYRSEFSDVIGTATVPYNNGTTSQFQALGSQLIQGVQMNGNFTFSNFNLYANYTYTDPVSTKQDTDSENIPIGDIAKHQINAGVNYSFLNNFNLFFRMNYVGERKTGKGTTVDTNPHTSIDPFAVFHTTLTYNDTKFIKGLSAQLIINNLFNKNYYHPGIRTADDITYASLIPQDERCFTIRLSYKF